MKLGITGLLPSALAAIDQPAIRRIRSMGFTGSAFGVDDPPSSISTDRALEIGHRFRDEGVDIVEYGHYQTSFVDPDAGVRSTHVATVREACRVAAAIGCPTVVVGIGSLNPAGQWFAHPDNFAPATRDRLAAALGEAASIAEQAGITLALECHVTTTLRNAATARELLDRVDSPALKVHLDPVNWMTFETVFDSGVAIGAMFDALGPEHISGAHSKGIAADDQLIAHLIETHTGSDIDLLDHAALLRGLAAMPGEPYLVIEHLTVDQMPGARAHLIEIARRSGLAFSGQTMEQAT